ncbi:hypothetical protein CEE36_10670 [candidate division TA06 bacterium B3_TA06]|uniref:Uncharacterized protein n=1 Tax=candidate division TA06 bacterium B3_TA06 TaxID=2012487 RepID=A0A532UU39_UNCT6|nr:MAG: hypothetical protein CEE36_10670 [candidate division TA06 bacterium B3_TA06]
MKSLRLQGKLLVVYIALVSVVSLLKADYYQPDFFPIGLTGINPTGWASNNCPYGNLETPWEWQKDADHPNGEDSLIFKLGVNCIGSEDAYRYYLMSFHGPNSQDNYLYKVCVPSFDPTDSVDSIFLITAAYHSTIRFTDYYNDTTEHVGSTTDIPPNAFFRPPYWGKCGGDTNSTSPYGDPKFGHDCSVDGGTGYYPYGTTYDNWNDYDGDTTWHKMADEAVDSFAAYFSHHLDTAKYIWGYNLITEDPATYRNFTNLSRPPWHGCWAAVDRIFRGHNTGFKASITDWESDSAKHAGIRGVEEASSAFNNGHRMIIAKSSTSPMHRGGYNIFEALPDLDAFVGYSHGWCHGNWNYGCDSIFDWFLYGDPSKPQAKGGRHNIAIYFQRYGKTNLAYPDQKRRWIPALCLEWQIDKNNLTKAKARRPCPPEIRCAAYLVLSRGAKGLLFHPWTYNYKDTNTVDLDPSDIAIPSYGASQYHYYNLGLRDQVGYPFGEGGPRSGTHKLNSGGGGSTYWHTNRDDTTYDYLANSLIPEIKKIAPKLMQLDWVNAYSLNSTAPEWRSPCPHYYVDDVWGAEFMDVAFFDHPYEPIGVEYFMMVNREGIADMTNRTVSVALDAEHWPEEDTLILTDIANADNPRKLKRVGERFTFTEVFEPGEGKLYRVAPTNEAPITLVPSTEGGVR